MEVFEYFRKFVYYGDHTMEKDSTNAVKRLLIGGKVKKANSIRHTLCVYVMRYTLYAMRINFWCNIPKIFFTLGDLRGV